MRTPFESTASKNSGSSYQAANVTRRKIDISAHSSAGDGRVLPHGVVSWKVSYQPAVDGMRASDWTQAPYFWSQVRPESAGQARPAARAAGVSRSSHLL